MPAIKEVVSLLCDDLRTETGRKVSLMGIYGSAIRAKGTEITFPRLTIFKRLTSDGVGTYTADLDLIGPSGKSALGSGQRARMAGVKLGKEVNLGIGLGPLTLDEPGEYEMRLTLRSELESDVVLSHRFLLELGQGAGQATK